LDQGHARQLRFCLKGALRNWQQPVKNVATVNQQPPEELSELKALRAAVIEHAIVAITDSEGRITFVNDKFCAISKYSREELLGNDLRIVNSGHHPEEYFHQLWTTIAAGKTWHGEFRNRARDGSTFWIETTVSPQLGQDGKPSQYIAVSTDISEYATLRKTSAAFETVMKTATDHIFFKDRHSRFVRASRALLHHFGVAQLSQLRGKTDLDFFAEEHALAAAQDEQAIVRSGQPMLNKEEKEIHSDGLVTWALTSKMPWHDKDGNLIGTMGVSRDITALKHAQQEAAEWQARFKFLLNSLPVGISWAQIAGDGRTTQRLINDEHLRICGITREETEKWDCFRRITHPDDVKRQDELHLQLAHGKIDRYSMEKRYLRPDGQTVWVLFFYQVRNCGEGIFEDLSGVLDITELKTAEEKLRLAELLFDLAGQIAKVGVWTVELPERTMHWTEEVYQIHEAPPDYEPTLEGALEFYTPECRETFRNAFEACLRDGTPYNLELEMITATGKRIRVRTTGRADILEGRPQRVFGAMQDITGIKGKVPAPGPEAPHNP
jgi:PAS domain S-box-containing protein